MNGSVADRDGALRAVLSESQRLGFLGERNVDEVIAHARGFLTALDADGAAALRVVDLGSGGGVPGLVIAYDQPRWQLTLVDRRAKRTDFLARVVSRLGWSQRVTVRCADVTEVIRTDGGSFDAAVARGFGPPATTLAVARRLVTDGGRIVISEPPAGARWDDAGLRADGVRHHEVTTPAGRLAVFDLA